MSTSGGTRSNHLTLLSGLVLRHPAALRRLHGKHRSGLGLRHDRGPQYTANPFLGELRWLGAHSTRSYVGEPECNGIMEQWIRTLKEECLHLHDPELLEQTRGVIGKFIDDCNSQRLLKRHGRRIPAEVHEHLRQAA